MNGHLHVPAALSSRTYFRYTLYGWVVGASDITAKTKRNLCLAQIDFWFFGHPAHTLYTAQAKMQKATFMDYLCYRLWIFRESNGKLWGYYLSRQCMEYRRFRNRRRSGPVRHLAVKQDYASSVHRAGGVLHVILACVWLFNFCSILTRLNVSL